MRDGKPKTTGRWAALAAGLAMALWGGPAAAYQIADGLTLNGKFYGDATWAEHRDDSGFHLKRSYVTLKAAIQPGLTAKLTLDQRSESDRVFVKHAYVEKTFPHGMAVWAGQAGTPFVPYDEANFWGYRYVVKSFTDYWGLQTSTDLGVSFLGVHDLGKAAGTAGKAEKGGAAGKAANRRIAYQVSLLNGEGYQNSPDGHGFALAGRGNVDLGKAHAGLYFHEERDRAGVNEYNPSRVGIFGFWDDPYFRAGGQLVIADDGSAFGTAAGNAAGAQFDSARGINVQGRVKLPTTHEAWVFARWDDMRLARGQGHRFFGIVGAASDVAKGLTVAPNIRVEDTGDPNRRTDYTFTVNAQLLI